jgi:hypothetical protein
MTSNRKLIGIGATALSLALAVATPAFAVRLRGGGAMHVGSVGFRGAQASVGPVVSSALMLPIAPSVGRTMTRRPGSIWATMVSGVLAHKSKKHCCRQSCGRFCKLPT